MPKMHKLAIYFEGTAYVTNMYGDKFGLNLNKFFMPFALSFVLA
jgi:hypothetical protein